MANQEQNPPQQEQPFVTAKQYPAKALKNFKVSFLTPTGGIYGEVGVNTFRNAIGAHYIPHSSEYVAPPSINIVRPWFETIGYGEAVPAKGTFKKSLFPPSLANGINIDYANMFWEDIIIKLNKKHKEKVVPYTRFLSILIMQEMKEGYGDGELTLYLTQVFSSFIIHFKSVSGNDASTASTTEVDPGKSAPSDFVPQQQVGNYPHLTKKRKEASSFARQVEEEEASSTIKLEDLAKLVSNVQPSFKYLDLPKDDHVNIVDDSDKDKEDESQKHKLEIEKNKAEAEVALLKAQPFFSIVEQLNELLVKSLQTEFSKILSAHDFSNSLPTELKDLPSKFNKLTEEVKGLKKQVHKLEIELPGDLKKFLPNWKTLQKLSQVLHHKLLNCRHLSLLQNVTKTLNKFAQVLDFASSKARDQSVPSAGQADTMPGLDESAEALVFFSQY
nr:hypothetical protein [Tanacetum cinerariifolium]